MHQLPHAMLALIIALSVQWTQIKSCNVSLAPRVQALNIISCQRLLPMVTRKFTAKVPVHSAHMQSVRVQYHWVLQARHPRHQLWRCLISLEAVIRLTRTGCIAKHVYHRVKAARVQIHAWVAFKRITYLVLHVNCVMIQILKKIIQDVANAISRLMSCVRVAQWQIMNVIVIY